MFCSKEHILQLKRSAESMHNNINQYNFASIEESRSDPQLKTLSAYFFWMRHWPFYTSRRLLLEIAATQICFKFVNDVVTINNSIFIWKKKKFRSRDSQVFWKLATMGKKTLMMETFFRKILDRVFKYAPDSIDLKSAQLHSNTESSVVFKDCLKRRSWNALKIN